jgi:hypothetical protein
VVRLWRAPTIRIWFVQVVTPILCGVLLLFGVVGLGRAARTGLVQRETYTVAFADIECDPPAGMPRQEFLRQVRELSYQPAALHLLDKDLDARLKTAFILHPWVEAVEHVRVDGHPATAGKAKAHLRIDVMYRRPVLAVHLLGEPSSWKSNGLVVDRHGILLPTVSEDQHLPVLTTNNSRPIRSAGHRWEEPGVLAVAATVTFLQPYLTQLNLDSCEIELVEGDIVFRAPGVRIVWGHAPGKETEGEAPADVKLQRLLAYQSGHDGLHSLEHDVRLLAFQGHFPLSPARP